MGLARFIGDGFEHDGGAEATQLDWRWVWAARSDRRGRGSGTGVWWNRGGFSWVHWRWVWGRRRSWGSAIRSAMGLSGAIRPTRPWVEDWIWASPTIALSVLWLRLGVSDKSEWGEKFFKDGNDLKVKWFTLVGWVFYSQRKWFSVWPNFPCATKHVIGCKLFSRIHF